MYYKAISGSGHTLHFTNEQFLFNRGGDKISESIVRNGQKLDLRASTIIRYDWACHNTGLNVGLDFNFAANLPAGTELDVLGFPKGRGAENLNHVVPINSSCRVSRTGLDTDMTFMVSNDNLESGNSGGPVLYKDNGAYIVMGLVSGNSYEKGRVIPISAIAD
jgi:V8-like Glu-specific endopeptidase